MTTPRYEIVLRMSAACRDAVSNYRGDVPFVKDVSTFESGDSFVVNFHTEGDSKRFLSEFGYTEFSPLDYHHAIRLCDNLPALKVWAEETPDAEFPIVFGRFYDSALPTFGVAIKSQKNLEMLKERWLSDAG